MFEIAIPLSLPRQSEPEESVEKGTYGKAKLVRMGHRLQGEFIFILLVLLITVEGRAEPNKVDGYMSQPCDVSPANDQGATWWNYYERGKEYASGECWDKAVENFNKAIEKRYKDDDRARTYGLHFIDYFPHRELGIVYYHLGLFRKAMQELQISNNQEQSEHAKIYINKIIRLRDSSNLNYTIQRVSKHTKKILKLFICLNNSQIQ